MYLLTTSVNAKFHLCLLMFRGEATEEENLEEMVRTANPEEITIDEDEDDDEEKIEGNGE